MIINLTHIQLFQEKIDYGAEHRVWMIFWYVKYIFENRIDKGA